MENLIYTSELGGDHKIVFGIGKYFDNHLYIEMLYLDEEFNDWEPYHNLTVNLEVEPLDSSCGFVNTNDGCSNLLQWVIDNGLGEPTGRIAKSGFCTYWEVAFDLERLERFAFIIN